MSEAALSAILQGHAFVIGLVLGSFANAAIARLPFFQSMWVRSHCDTCGATIRPRDLIPVVSYILLKGRCRDCSASIPPAVPLVEVLGGLGGWLLWRKLVPDVALLDAATAVAWLLFLCFLTGLIILAYTDIRHHIIPDETSILAVPVAILGHAWLGWLGYEGWLMLPWRSAVIGALFGGGLFALIAAIARMLKGADAMGWGDVKLVALLGAALGPMPGLVLTIMMASFIGAGIGLVALLVLNGKRHLPFGPSLAVAAALWVFYGDLMIQAWFPGMLFLLNTQGA